ncbi:MAG: ligase-associated DNA damage response DEXH box helicase [Flavobacteriales bacterium]|nr:ligase-associated DNA damage response DEXH box helicase [Flavobacteriales bacterium]
MGKEVNEARKWMHGRGWKPQPFQESAWLSLASGEEGIVNAPTGSGKTYSLMLPFLARFSGQTKAPEGIRLIWITPIRALSKEIYLSANRVIQEMKLPVTLAIRTGDTSTEERNRQKKEIPNILITTPESLHLMFCAKGMISRFKHLELIVADEWHELLGTKRGVMLELAISRLKTLSPALQIWGISATIGNLDEAMHALLGTDRSPKGQLIRSDIKKDIEVISVLPEKPERMPWAGHLGTNLLPQLLPVIHGSTSTLIFTNVRSQCEIWYRKLLEADPELAGVMAMHHGSISKEIRNWVEDALYEGRLKAVVCTSSLDLGVDFAPVETIVQIGGPKGIARFVQRAGRSGHRPDSKSQIYFLPTHSLELIEAAALRKAVDDNYLEDRVPLNLCFDVLVQYLVTLAVGDGFVASETLHELRSTFCFASITDEEWKWALAFTAFGGESLGSYNDYHRIHEQDGRYVVSSQRIARRHRLSIGAIVSDTMMSVRLNRGGLLGHIEESFISSLNIGDHFWFAGLNLELTKVKELTAYTKKSNKPGGRSPAWLGGKLPLSSKMSDMLRFKMEEAAEQKAWSDIELKFIQPIIALQKERSHVPAKNELLIEKFQTDDGYHVVIYPFEGRFVHEGLAALFALRISRMYPITFSFAYNDYALELLSDQPIRIEDALGEGMLDTNDLERDVLQGVNSSELANRRFRDIAAIAGLVFKGYPGQPIKERHLQSSSQLIFQVFEDYDPKNLLLRQSYDEVIHHQLELPRMRKALERMSSQHIIIKTPDKPTPFAFPVMVDRLRDRMSSESLEERIRRMSAEWADE